MKSEAVQNVLQEKLEEESDYPSLTQRCYSKSWSFPNVTVESDDNMHIQPKPLQLKESLKAERNRSIAKWVLLVQFACFLCFYLYIVSDPLAKEGVKLDLTKNDAQSSCFHQFRHYNCTLDQPVGQICLRLYECITKPRKNETIIQVPKEEKIENVEELLQNILLLLSGIGFMGITSRIFRLPRALRQGLMMIRRFAGQIRQQLFCSRQKAFI